MSLYRRYDTENQPSLITTNTQQRAPIFASSATCKLLLETLYEVRDETRYQLLAFVIMPEHLHLVLAGC